jgi:hypothetical protein
LESIRIAAPRWPRPTPPATVLVSIAVMVFQCAAVPPRDLMRGIGLYLKVPSELMVPATRGTFLRNG